MASSTKKSIRLNIVNNGGKSGVREKLAILEKRVKEKQDNQVLFDLVQITIRGDPQSLTEEYCRDWDDAFDNIALLDPEVLHLKAEVLHLQGPPQDTILIPAQSLARAITPNLHALELVDVYLDGDKEPLVNALQNNARGLERFVSKYTDTTDQRTALADIVRALATSARHTQRPPTLKEAILSFTDVEDLKAIFNDLCQLPSLESLVLLQAAAGRDRRMGTPLQVHLPSLVQSQTCALKRLSLCVNKIDQASMRTIGNLLRVNTTLEELTLDMVFLRDTDYLMDALKTDNQTLKHLTLTFERAPDKRCQNTLISMMKENYSLESLKIKARCSTKWWKNKIVEEYLLLNRTGRGRVERHESMEPREWLEAVIGCRGNVGAIFYYLGKHPGLITNFSLESKNHKKSNGRNAARARKQRKNTKSLLTEYFV